MRRALATLLAFFAFPAAAQAETVYETVRVPTVNGDSLHVEIARPAGQRVPVILTYSPYNTLSEGTAPNLASDDLGQRYVPRGYARAVADVIGTRNSTGCWDYGGPIEQQSGVDLVNALARKPWSTGKVAMIGGSYDGTTANMVAVRGADAPGLKAIVPELAISRWYGYAYSAGVRYFLNSQRPTDEGVDTPLAFDFGLARTPPTQPSPEAIEAMQDRLRPCDADAHTAHGYDTSPDYDAFWLARDYLRRAANVRAAALVVHGWQDYNVKQSEGVDFYRALPATTFRRLFMFQGGHQSPPAAQFLPVLDAFFATTLKGAAVAPALQPKVITQGRDAAGPRAFRTEASWPPAGTSELRLALGRRDGAGTLAASAPPAKASFTDLGATSEEAVLRDLGAEATWLTYTSAPQARPVRIAGTPRLTLQLSTSSDHGHITPTLVDIAPDGSAKPISRGFVNLRYRGGLAREIPMPPGRAVFATVRFSPQDHTVLAGHRIAVVVAGSNVIWALPDEPAGTRTTVYGGSTLVLPLAGG